jgi:hypothetical protein
VDGVNGTLLVVVVTGLLSLGLLAFVAVLVAAVGLFWLRRRSAPEAPRIRPRGAPVGASRDPVRSRPGRTRDTAPVQTGGRSPEGAPDARSSDRGVPDARSPDRGARAARTGRSGAPVETEWQPPEPPMKPVPRSSRPPSRPGSVPPASARPGPVPLDADPPEAPPIGFFDDETSTGQAFRSAGQLQSLSSAFLSVPPTAVKDLLGGAGSDDDDDEGEGATEIFSASAINAELAALLDEPEEGVAVATPAAPKRR